VGRHARIVSRGMGRLIVGRGGVSWRRRRVLRRINGLRGTRHTERHDKRGRVGYNRGRLRCRCCRRGRCCLGLRWVRHRGEYGRWWLTNELARILKLDMVSMRYGNAVKSDALVGHKSVWHR